MKGSKHSFFAIVLLLLSYPAFCQFEAVVTPNQVTVCPGQEITFQVHVYCEESGVLLGIVEEEAEWYASDPDMVFMEQNTAMVGQECGTVTITASLSFLGEELDAAPAVLTILAQTPTPTPLPTATPTPTPAVQVEVIDVDPNTINMKSKGNFVTCYIGLADRDPEDIDIGSLRLNGTLAPESSPTGYVDFDEDGDVELMVKFSRPVLISMLSPGEAVVLTLTGTAAGEPFSGEDIVRVIWNGDGFCPTQCVTNVFSLEATALKSAYSITYSIDDLPEGASLNPLTGELTWTPPDGAASLGIDPIAVTVSGEGFSITERVPVGVLEHDLR